MSEKVHKIRTLQDIGKIIDENNYNDIIECLKQSLMLHIHFKKNGVECDYDGIDWTDDGINSVKEIKVNIEPND